MAAPAYIVFGQDLTDTEPKPDNFFGASGWWQVPTQWSIKTDLVGQIWASPNADFSTPVYACKINGASGELVFYDQYRNTQIGITQST